MLLHFILNWPFLDKIIEHVAISGDTLSSRLCYLEKYWSSLFSIGNPATNRNIDILLVIPHKPRPSKTFIVPITSSFLWNVQQNLFSHENGLALWHWLRCLQFSSRIITKEISVGAVFGSYFKCLNIMDLFSDSARYTIRRENETQI